MKNLFHYVVLTVAVLSAIFATALSAQSPSQAAFLKQTGFEFDSLYTWHIHLSWQDGIVDNENPRAEGYEIYRIPNYNREIELDEFELITYITSDASENGTYTYSDDVVIGSYRYFVKGVYQGQTGSASPVIIAFAPASYCVNMNAPIVDFVSFPELIGFPGMLYSYKAFAKHRSPRVQGWVRYKLLQGPEGMTINNQNGQITWEVPTDAFGDYYVEIEATSDEDSRAQSIQEWYIRIASATEMNIFSSVEQVSSADFSIYPNPASEYIEVQLSNKGLQPLVPSDTHITITNMLGVVVSTSVNFVDTSASGGQVRIDVSHLPAGVYFLRIGEQTRTFVKQ